MTLWRRLSARQEAPSPDEPYEGVPEHLLSPLIAWIHHLFPFHAGDVQDADMLRLVALATRIALVPGDSDHAAYQAVVEASIANPQVCLDVIDALLKFGQPDDLATENLRSVLLFGGSAWEVAADGKALVRRLDATTVSRQAVATIAADNASPLLKDAFAKAYGRKPDVLAAWGQAIRAVEAVIVAVVYPDHYDATLGHVIDELVAHPDRWRIGLNSGQDPIEQTKTFTAMLRMIWEVPGLTEDGKGKPPVRETQAIVQLAVTVVQWLRDGLLHPN